MKNKAYEKKIPMKFNRDFTPLNKSTDMKLSLLILILSVFECITYGQNNNSHYYKYAILRTDTLTYRRHFTNINDTLKIDTSKTTIVENSLLKVLSYKPENKGYILENNTMFYTDGTDEAAPETWIHKDTLFAKDEDLDLIDSVSVPGKYYSTILNELYGKMNDAPPVIYVLDYVKEKNYCFISYSTDDGRAADVYCSVYKINKDRPIYYFESECDNCKYDSFKNYFLIYNHQKAEVFDTLNYVYDSKLDKYKSKKNGLTIYFSGIPSILSVDNKDDLLYYDRNRHEFIAKKKVDNKFYYETYRILNGEFMKKN